MSSNRVEIRWLIERDLPEVLEIERESFEVAWTEDDFIRFAEQDKCHLMVIYDVVSHGIYGFFGYELHRHSYQLVNLAVHPEFRHQGFGSQMVRRMIRKLFEVRNGIVTHVREGNLTAQLFFRNLGFEAVGVLKSFYEDTNEDAYVMEFLLEKERAKRLLVPNVRNRVAAYLRI